MIIDSGLANITQMQMKQWGITEIVFDSNEAREGVLFCALVGIHTDGHRFIKQAKNKGVRHFLVSNSAFIEDEDHLVYFLCSDTRSMMAKFASVFYAEPSKRLKVIGVTGTDGKSTTAQLIMQLLEALGHRCGLISTVNIKTTGNLDKNNLRQSTPEAPQIEKALFEMLSNDMEYAVLEATSHGLSEATSRLAQIQFAGGVFTNVTIEHLEFHKTVECYREDKANLFRKVAQNHGISVINGLSEHQDVYVQAAQGSSQILLYAKPGSDVWVESVRNTEQGFEFEVVTREARLGVELPLVGYFNIENALAALLMVSCITSNPILEVAKHFGALRAPDGRMLLITHEPFKVIVDYAHTPGAFERLLPQMREVTAGRLVVLFGSGGERNLEKRPIQGRLADQYGDIVILTNEDPRLEDEFVILKDIATGITNKELDSTLFMIPDRRKAIDYAVGLCKPGDTLLLLGKGHEGSIIGPLGKQEWDEVAVARQVLKDLGYLNG